MGHYYKITKNPKTHQFERAAWLDVGLFYYVAFPDGGLYTDKYCVWEFQEDEQTRAAEELFPLPKTA